MTDLNALLDDPEIAKVFERPVRRYKRYAEYRDSGIEWLGEVPKHWDVRRWKHCCRIAEGQVDPSDEALADRILIAPNHVESGTGRILFTETASGQAASSGKFIVRAGDLIYSKIRPALNKICIAEGDWLCSADMYPVRAIRPDLDTRFLLYFMLSDPFVRLMVDESMRVAMPKVNRETLTAALLLLPTYAEQRAISEWLDRGLARLDALISKKEQLIELLQEKRSALITRAVTKGLDPKVPMKDSGVEWLDFVPRHWKLRPLKRLLAHGPKNGISPPPADSSGVPSFSISAVRDGHVDVMGNLKQVALSRAEARAFQMRKHDLLLVRGNGNLDIVGLCGLVEEFPEGCTYPDILMLMRPMPHVLPEFLVAAINSPYVRAQIELAARTTNGTYKVSGDDIRSLLLVVPPLAEQQAITNANAAFNDSHGRLLRSVLEAVNRLKELRSALITSAVTGKIDVREEPS